MAFDRVILIVLDSVGIGEMPDAAAFGDAGSDTLGHVCSHRPLRIPNLESLGLGCIRPLANIQAVAEPLAAFGKMALASNGKDTTTGHWELAGIVLEKAFPTYPAGFPAGSDRGLRGGDWTQNAGQLRWPREPRSFSDWVPSTFAPVSRSSILPRTVSSRSPRMRK